MRYQVQVRRRGQWLLHAGFDDAIRAARVAISVSYRVPSRIIDADGEVLAVYGTPRPFVPYARSGG